MNQPIQTDTAITLLPGGLTGSAVGIILKELVRRAMVEISSQRFSFVATVKTGYSGMPDDVFTTADTAAQEIYIRSIKECFPGYGIIGEESYLHIPCAIPGRNLYFTLDPLDGTKAYKRGQSYGIGTMIALVDGDTGEVLSAYVGDPFSMEIFGYRPGGAKVWRINKLNTNTELPKTFGDDVQLLSCGIAREHKHQTPICVHLFNISKKCLVEGSSIGVMLSRLWTGECTYVLLEPSWVTPWDETPLLGICRMLGYDYWEPNVAGDGWVPMPTHPIVEKYHHNRETLITHRKFRKQVHDMVI